MRVRGGGKTSSACTSGLKKRPSGNAILQNKASQQQARPMRPDGRDAHFVVADEYGDFFTMPTIHCPYSRFAMNSSTEKCILKH